MGVKIIILYPKHCEKGFCLLNRLFVSLRQSECKQFHNPVAKTRKGAIDKF